MKSKFVCILIALVLVCVFGRTVLNQEMGKPTKGGSIPSRSSSALSIGTIPTFGPFAVFATLSYSESFCPTVVKSLIATKAIGTVSATLTLSTDYAVHVGYRYHLPNQPFIYRHDSDNDSLSHTITLSGLEISGTNLTQTQYTWYSMTRYASCDSTAYGDSISFYTNCGVLTFTSPLACYNTDQSTNEVEINGNYYIKMQFRYKRTLPTESGYTVSTMGSFFEKAGCHYWEIADLDASSTYQWEYRYLNVCGDTSAYAIGGTQTTDASGHFTNTSCLCNLLE